MRRADKKMLILIAISACLLAVIYSCTNPKDPVDSVSPTVSITNPLNNSQVPNTVDIRAEASDNECVVKVEFYVDDQLYDADEVSPWSCLWTTSMDDSGEHTIFAKAFDEAGNTDRSELVTVTCENIPPAAITDLAQAESDVHGNVTLTWTAPGDNGNTGTAVAYDVRHYWVAVTSDNWSSATQIEGEPEPQEAGSTESMVASGLSLSTTYYFAIRAQDATGNWSDVSNNLVVTTEALLAEPVTYAVDDTLANTIVASDLDGDEFLDLVFCHRTNTDNVSIMYNNGDGTFMAPVLIYGGEQPSGVAAGDFDEDGYNDLVTSNWRANNTVITNIVCHIDTSYIIRSPNPLKIDTVIVDDCDTTRFTSRSLLTDLHNEGGGGLFEHYQRYGFYDTLYWWCDSSVYVTLPGPIYLCLFCLDIYQDAIPRAVPRVGPCVEELDIIEYDSTRLRYFCGQNPTSIQMVDVDVDGSLDLIVSNRLSSTLSVLFNDGAGLFLDPISINTGGTGPAWICAADLNGDGWLDLASANSTADQVAVVQNLTGRTFSTATNYVVGDNPMSIVALDVDDDGDNDLVAADANDETISILRNLGNGTFTRRETRPVGLGARAIAAEDLTGDGLPELVVANYWDDNISVLMHGGQFVFYSHNTVEFDVDGGPGALAVADFDRDGDNDVAVLNQRTNTVSILYNRMVEQ